MVGAADHVADAHVDIIDHDAEVIRRMFVRSKQDEVFDRIAFDGNFIKDGVVVADSAFRDSEADGAFIVIRESAVHQAFSNVPVQVEPLRLVVRALVPVKSEPRHRIEDAASHVFTRTLDVGIFDTKDECALIFSREKPVEESGPRAADVEITRRGWGKADANTHLLSFRSALTASRTTSALGSSRRGRIWSTDAGSPMLPMILAIPARTLGSVLRRYRLSSLSLPWSFQSSDRWTST